MLIRSQIIFHWPTISCLYALIIQYARMQWKIQVWNHAAEIETLTLENPNNRITVTKRLAQQQNMRNEKKTTFWIWYTASAPPLPLPRPPRSGRSHKQKKIKWQTHQHTLFVCVWEKCFIFRCFEVLRIEREKDDIPLFRNVAWNR